MGGKRLEASGRHREALAWYRTQLWFSMDLVPKPPRERHAWHPKQLAWLARLAYQQAEQIARIATCLCAIGRFDDAIDALLDSIGCTMAHLGPGHERVTVGACIQYFFLRALHWPNRASSVCVCVCVCLQKDVAHMFEIVCQTSTHRDWAQPLGEWILASGGVVNNDRIMTAQLLRHRGSWTHVPQRIVKCDGRQRNSLAWRCLDTCAKADVALHINALECMPRLYETRPGKNARERSESVRLLVSACRSAIRRCETMRLPSQSKSSGLAWATCSIGMMCVRERRWRSAIGTLRSAIDLSFRAGDDGRYGTGEAFAALVVAHMARNEYASANTVCTAALVWHHRHAGQLGSG